MKRTLLAAPLLLCLLLTACGGGSRGSAAADMTAPQSEAYTSDAAEPETPMKESVSESWVATDRGSLPGAGSSLYDQADAKIIRTASLYLQTTEFDTAVEGLDALVEELGGYFQSATQDSGSYYSSSTRRYGYYTIRVPKASFDSFLNSVGEVAHVVSRTVDSQDVGEAYYDAELRLATLETKHERLLTLLEQATLMEDIISIESALSDVEYEIQSYTSTLDRYDALIDFSTITVELQEVARVTQSSGETDGLGVRLSTAFARGWTNFCDGVADLTVWIALHFMGCIIFLVVVVVVIVVVRKRFIHFKSKKRKDPPAPPAEQ